MTLKNKNPLLKLLDSSYLPFRIKTQPMSWSSKENCLRVEIIQLNEKQAYWFLYIFCLIFISFVLHVL